MFGARWRLLRLAGIPIFVDLSWLIILALLTISLANQFPSLLHEYFPDATERFDRFDYWVMGLFTAVAFFA